MSAVRKIDGVPVHEERIFTFKCRVKGCGKEIDVTAKTSTAARGFAMKYGWDFRKEPSLQGPLEYWTCAGHTEEWRDLIKKHRVKRLLRYTSEAPVESEDEKQVKIAKARHADSQTCFERAFGRILSAEEITACGRLLHAMQIVECAGNATASYDGSPVDSFDRGSKTIQGYVLDARQYVRRCEKAVVGEVQMKEHDAWKVLTNAIQSDWTVLKTGEEICRMRRIPKKNEKDCRALASSIVSKAAAAIVRVRYERSG